MKHKSMGLRVLTWLSSTLTVFFLGCQPPGDDFEVQTIYGTLVGKDHAGVHKFLGVPFASPPIGALRWQAPIPPEAWSGKRSAHYYSPPCIQGGFPTDAMGTPSEDCLYLNIWAPKSPGPHPVMMWIHGGGLIIGSGNATQSEGQVLAAQKDVVVVSINYRLAHLGFLALPEQFNGGSGIISGNQGFLDQIAALKWIQDNIQAFNGDPDNVTIFGLSGGAVSSCNLLASPLTDGLLHKAIMQSGHCNMVPPQSLVEGQLKGADFLQKVGCENAPDPIHCAQGLSVEKIQRALGDPPNLTLEIADYPEWPFPPAPIIDGHFLPNNARQLLADSNKQDVSIMIGVSKNEGSLMVGAWITQPLPQPILNFE